MPGILGKDVPVYTQKRNPANVIQRAGSPSSAAVDNDLGTLYVDVTANAMYALVDKTSGTATWAVLGGATLAVQTLSGDSGTATPASGNIQIAGTANQISTSGAAAAITLSLPSAVVAPGTVAATSGFVGSDGSGAPSAGNIGEQIRSAIATGSAVSLTTATAADVTSIALTAGVWDVSGVVEFTAAGTTTVSAGQFASVNTTSATLGTLGDNSIEANWVDANVQQGNCPVYVPPYRLTLAAPATVYLVAQATFGVSTMDAFGRISATRVA